MGGTQSSENTGFRIFKVNPASPAAEAGLEIFFDFITEINGTKLQANQKAFFDTIVANENKEMTCSVYNIKTGETRTLKITPKKWGGVGLLGATVRYDTIDMQDNGSIRVLEVHQKSPAHQAGLVSHKDYMLGTPELIFREVDELVELVSRNINKEVMMYVYNSDMDEIREVIITPNVVWGGEGCLGCEIGTGLLHRIPTRIKNAAVTNRRVSAKSERNIPVSTEAPAKRSSIPPPAPPAPAPQASSAAEKSIPPPAPSAPAPPASAGENAGTVPKEPTPTPAEVPPVPQAAEASNDSAAPVAPPPVPEAPAVPAPPEVPQAPAPPAVPQAPAVPGPPSHGSPPLPPNIPMPPPGSMPSTATPSAASDGSIPKPPPVPGADGERLPDNPEDRPGVVREVSA